VYILVYTYLFTVRCGLPWRNGARESAAAATASTVQTSLPGRRDEVSCSCCLSPIYTPSMHTHVRADYGKLRCLLTIRRVGRRANYGRKWQIM